eukprot:scaffold15258_cov111-Isochrysis_galbana.AAC.2
MEKTADATSGGAAECEGLLGDFRGGCYTRTRGVGVAGATTLFKYIRSRDTGAARQPKTPSRQLTRPPELPHRLSPRPHAPTRHSASRLPPSPSIPCPSPCSGHFVRREGTWLRALQPAGVGS